MHAIPTYIALAALLIASTAFVKVEPAVGPDGPDRPVRRFTIDFRPAQDAWAWLRGRGRRAIRRELDATAHYLHRIRDLADDVLRGTMSPGEAHGALMYSRYPSLRTRCACAEQLRAYLYADVARVWVDDEWPARLAAYRAAGGAAG